MQDDDLTIESDSFEEGMSEEELDAQESRMDAKVQKLKKELEHVKKEKQEYLDGWQRSKADYVNALKRFEEEKAVATEKGKAKAAQAFIAVIDTLGRAEQAGEIPESFKGIAKQLNDAANGLGLKKIGMVGESFDPNLHEALGQDAVEEMQKDDTITAVLECGWQMGETVLRPAKVRVGQYG